MQSVLDEAGTEVWPKIAPLLDAAVAGLREKDRRAIVLRFYEGRNLRDVGLALGASEDAAEKRVNRALEKLRKFFTKRGVDSTAATIAETISANSVQAAPVALAKSVTAVAVAKGATASISTLTLIKGALKIMAWSKAKTAIVIGAGILLAATATPFIWHHYWGPDSWKRRFDAVYKLKAGEVVRYIAPPFIPERAEYYHKTAEWSDSAKSIRTSPDFFIFHQDKNEFHRNGTDGGFGFKQHSLQQVLNATLGINESELEAPKELLDLNLPGDWTIRDGISPETFLAALEPILFKATGHPIHFEKRMVERDAIVAQGRFMFEYLQKPMPVFPIQIYSVKTNSRFLGNGVGNLQEFLKRIGERLNVCIVNEVQVNPKLPDQFQFEWTYHSDADFSRMGNRRSELTDKVLNNLAAQTELSFTHTNQAVEVWSVIEQP